MDTFSQSELDIAVDKAVKEAVAKATAAHNSEKKAPRAELQITWTATKTGWRGAYVIELSREDLNNTLAGNHRNPKGKRTGTTEGGTGGWVGMSTPDGFPSHIQLGVQVGVVVRAVEKAAAKALAASL